MEMGLPSLVVSYYNMKYQFVIDRIRKVIYSCENIFQLTYARKYSRMLINAYIKDKCFYEMEVNYNDNYKIKEELIIMMYDLVSRHQVMIR